MKTYNSIEIKFINNKTLSLKNSILLINQNGENEWYSLENNSVAGFSNILIKIIDKSNIEKKTYFFFLKSAQFEVLDNNISIVTNSDNNCYTVGKNKKDILDKLKEINKAIKLLEAKKIIGLSIDEYLLLDELIERRYKQNLCYILKLKGEKDE